MNIDLTRNRVGVALAFLIIVSIAAPTPAQQQSPSPEKPTTPLRAEDQARLDAVVKAERERRAEMDLAQMKLNEAAQARLATVFWLFAEYGLKPSEYDLTAGEGGKFVFVKKEKKGDKHQ